MIHTGLNTEPYKEDFYHPDIYDNMARLHWLLDKFDVDMFKEGVDERATFTMRLWVNGADVVVETGPTLSSVLFKIYDAGLAYMKKDRTYVIKEIKDG